MNNQIIIIGAGAAGLMCAIAAAEKGCQVLVLDHANKAGKKILISGGGRCNFTNMYTEPSNYISKNPHFCKSALKRYTPWDFITEVDRNGITWHEKTLGQLFSDQKSKAILNMLLDRCRSLDINIILDCKISAVQKLDSGQFNISSSLGKYSCDSLVIATGAMSFPTMGATDFGHKIAKQFNINVTKTKPGLVPFTVSEREKARFSQIAGISQNCIMECNGHSFRESILFTHKGVSGPATLQISSYWEYGDSVMIDLSPDTDLSEELIRLQRETPKKQLSTILQRYFSSRLVECFTLNEDTSKPIAEYSHQELNRVANLFKCWKLTPSGTEGYKKAEVTVGGVDTDEISSKTFESKKVKNLYFIGEVLDVTGHLGGFNFQWAWASGYCCGQSL